MIEETPNDVHENQSTIDHSEKINSLLNEVLSDLDNHDQNQAKLQRIALLMAEEIYSNKSEVREMFKSKNDMSALVRKRLENLTFIVNRSKRLRVNEASFYPSFNQTTGELSSATIVLTKTNKRVLAHEIHHLAECALYGKELQDSTEKKRTHLTKSRKMNIYIFSVFLGCDAAIYALAVNMSPIDSLERTTSQELLALSFLASMGGIVASGILYLIRQFQYDLLPTEIRANKAAKRFSKLK